MPVTKVVANLWIRSRWLMSATRFGEQAGILYSRCGRTKAPYKGMKADFEVSLKKKKAKIYNSTLTLIVKKTIEFQWKLDSTNRPVLRLLRFARLIPYHPSMIELKRYTLSECLLRCLWNWGSGSFPRLFLCITMPLEWLCGENKLDLELRIVYIANGIDFG